MSTMSTSVPFVAQGYDELELYGEVELRRDPAGAWWFGRWYSWVKPAGVRGGVAVGCPGLEEIGHAEFEMARAQRWAMGPNVSVDDDDDVLEGVRGRRPEPD